MSEVLANEGYLYRFLNIYDEVLLEDDSKKIAELLEFIENMPLLSPPAPAPFPLTHNFGETFTTNTVPDDRWQRLSPNNDWRHIRANPIRSCSYNWYDPKSYCAQIPRTYNRVSYRDEPSNLINEGMFELAAITDKTICDEFYRCQRADIPAFFKHSDDKYYFRVNVVVITKETALAAIDRESKRKWQLRQEREKRIVLGPIDDIDF